MPRYYVRVRQMHVVVDHVQPRVTEDALQGKHIPTGLQVGLRKGASEQLYRQPQDVAARPQPPDPRMELCAGQRKTLLHQAQRLAERRQRRRLAAVRRGVEHRQNTHPHRHVPVLGTLATHASSTMGDRPPTRIFD